MLFVAQRQRQQSNGSQSEAAICGIVEVKGFVRTATWNARALLCGNTKQRRRKVHALKTFIGNSDVFMIQEAHGFQEWADVEFNPIREKYAWFQTGSHPSSGGLIFIIKKDMLKDSAYELHSVIDGRVAYFAIKFASADSREVSLNFVNVHNFGLDSTNMMLVESSIRPLIDQSLSSYSNTITFVAGDWNFLANGDARLVINNPFDDLNASND